MIVLTHELEREVRAFAAAAGISPEVFVRDAVVEFLDRVDQRP